MIGSGARIVQGRDSTVTMPQRPNAAIPSEIDSDRKLSMIAPCGGSYPSWMALKFVNCENFKIVPAPLVACAATDWRRGGLECRHRFDHGGPMPCRIAGWHCSRCH